MIRPISRRSNCRILDDYSCPRCDTPKPFLYKNNDSKGQLLYKICDTRFSPDGNRLLLTKLRYPHYSNFLIPKKDRKHFTIHKHVNLKYSYYLRNLRKMDNQDLKDEFGKNKYKLHYIYHEFIMDFFSTGLSSLSKNASSLKFNKHNAHVMSLTLTLHVNLGFSLRRTPRALKDLYSISLSHQQTADYCKAVAVCIRPSVDQYPYERRATSIADGTYAKIRGIKTYIWLTTNAANRSIIGYRVSDNCGIGPCIPAIRMALQGLTKLPENFEFTADDCSAYPLVAMEFVKSFGRPLTFHITQVIGFTDNDAVSKEHRPFRQMIERLDRTYKVSYHHTNSFDNIDGTNYEFVLWVAYCNFLRPHKHNQYRVLNEVKMPVDTDSMPDKQRPSAFLDQQTILNMQKNGILEMERGYCQQSRGILKQAIRPPVRICHESLLT